MTQREDHEELVRDVRALVTAVYRVGYEDTARAILALVADRLRAVTPEMAESWEAVYRAPFDGKTPIAAHIDWLAMLGASPLYQEPQK